MDKYGTGIKGEEEARKYLVEQGYKILECNVNFPNVGELDIVAKDGGVLVFIEVRTRSDARYGSPYETLTPSKIKKIIAASRMYIATRKAFASGYRYDVVSILHGKIELIKNAFFSRWH